MARTLRRKTHKAAVVLIPPKNIWEPIQRIRRRHDRQVGRWMPHVTLLYPFRPREEFAAARPEIARACAAVEPFTVTLAEFAFFDHASSYTMWLDPEPNEAAVRLQRELASAFPDCDDVSRFEAGFRPHLSVGQVRTREELDRLLGELRTAWEPLEFVARDVAMIWRGPQTGEVFEVARRVKLGNPGERRPGKAWSEGS